MAYIYERYEHLLRMWMDIWLPINIDTTTDTSPDVLKLAEILPDTSVQTMPLCFGWGCRTFQTASHVHGIPIWGVWAPLRLWMGIWLHTHTVTTTGASPDFERLADILPDASVQTMPLRFDWGCRTFQTASHVHVIHIWDVCAPSQVLEGHMALHPHCYHHSCFGKVGWKPTWCKCANHATTLWLRL